MDWIQLAIMGLLAFSLGNTVLYIGLKTLPATSTSFLLNGIPIATVLLGIGILGEYPRWLQWCGILLAMVGGIVFFWKSHRAHPGQADWFNFAWGVLDLGLWSDGEGDDPKRSR